MSEPKQTDMKKMNKELFRGGEYNTSNTFEVIEHLPLISGFVDNVSNLEELRKRRLNHSLRGEEGIESKFSDIKIVGYEKETPDRTISSANFLFIGYSAWQNIPITQKGFLKNRKDKALILLDQLDEEFKLYTGKFDHALQTSQGVFSAGTGYFLIGLRPANGELHLLNINNQKNTCDMILAVPNFIKYSQLHPSVSGSMFSSIYEMSIKAQLETFYNITPEGQKTLSGIIDIEGFKKFTQNFLDNLKGRGVRSEEIQKSLEDNILKFDTMRNKISERLDQNPGYENKAICIYGF